MPSYLRVPFPSARSVVLLALLFLFVGIITWVTIVENAAISSDLPAIGPPPTTDDNKMTEWLSTIGTVGGALLTGGALLYAALTYSKQSEDRHKELQDKHRAQAVTVSVRVLHGLLENKSRVEIRNSSTLPIYKVKIFCIYPDGHLLDNGELSQRVVIDNFIYDFDEEDLLYEAYALFTDSSGARWARLSTGELAELQAGEEDIDDDLFKALGTSRKRRTELIAVSP